MLFRYVLLITFIVGLHSADGMVKPFEDSYENPWDPLRHNKQLCKEAYEYRNKKDMNMYLQLLQQATEPISYRSYNGLQSELRTTGYFKAEYDYARLLDKKDNIPQALMLYHKSLRHSRYSTDDKAKETYRLSTDRVEEIWKKDPGNNHALVILAREHLTSLTIESVSRGFDLLELIENQVPKEEQFELFKKYDWESALLRIALLDYGDFAHRKGLGFFHRAQLKQHGICGIKDGGLASRYYIEALKEIQPNDTYKGKAESYLQQLAFAQERNLRSVAEYMQYVKSQKNWESYCAIGASILDGSTEILDAVYKELQNRPPGCVMHNVANDVNPITADNPITIEYFDSCYPDLFLVDSEVDDTISDQLRLKLTMLKVRYLVLKSKEYRVNTQKNPRTEVLPAYEAAISGYQELAKEFKNAYAKYKFQEQHGYLCFAAGTYASKIFNAERGDDPEIVGAVLSFHSKAHKLGNPDGSCSYALISLTAGVPMDEQKARYYLNLLEINAPKLADPDMVYKQMYDFFSGEVRPMSGVNVKNFNKAKEYAKKGSDAGNSYCKFKYGLLLLKDKDQKKREEGNQLIISAAQKGHVDADVWLKLKEIYDDALNVDSDGKSATESLRKFINATDRKIFAKLEKHELFNNIREVVTKKNPIFGKIITMAMIQRVQANSKKVDDTLRTTSVVPSFVNDGSSLAEYSVESDWQIDDSDFNQVQESCFHNILYQLKHAVDFNDLNAWENGKTSLESMAWGVHYVPRAPGQPRKIKKTPYWPAVYAVGAIALAEEKFDKAFQSAYQWRQHRLQSDYKDTQQGKKVDQNMDELFVELLEKKNLGAWGLQAAGLLACGRLHEVRDIVELFFADLHKVDMRSHPWYKDFFDLLIDFPFTEEQKNEQASTINFLKGVSHFFYPRVISGIDREVVHFKKVLEYLNPLYESNSLYDQSKNVVKTILVESNRRLALLGGLAPLHFSPGDFDRYIQTAAELGDAYAIYYQAIKRLPEGKTIPVEQKEAALRDLEMLAARGHKDAKIFLGKYHAGLLHIYPEDYKEEDPVFRKKAQEFVRDLANFSDPHSDVDALLIMGVTESYFPRVKDYLWASFEKGNKHDALRNLAYAMVAEKRTEDAIALIESQPDDIKRNHYLLLASLHLHLCKDAQSGIHFEKMKEYSMVAFKSLTSQDLSDLFLKADLQGQKKWQHDIAFGLFNKLEEYNQQKVCEFLVAILKDKASPELMQKLKQLFL